MTRTMGRGVRQRKPFAHGGPALIFAVDDEVLESVRPEIERIVAELGHEVPYEIVRASELADPNTEADFWFGDLRPRARASRCCA